MLVIWNPNAGSVATAEELRRELAARPKTLVRETSNAAEATDLVARQISDGENEIIAAGGDGTVNAVINGMMRAPHDVTLGVLPLGTANDWCSSLAIPDQLDRALQLVDGGITQPVDVVELVTPSSRRFYANIATGGNSHRVTESITSEMKQTWGPLCYLRGAIGVLADLRTFNVKIAFDSQAAESFEVWNIIVANGKTSAGRLAVAPKAVLDDGLLDVVIIREGTLLDLADMTMQLLTEAYIKSDQVEYRQARSISLESDPQILFSIDGDLVEHQPMHFKIHPAAINVVVGDGYHANQAKSR